MEAAKREFARVGFCGASTREIARIAGVHEASLFRHFQTKELLFLAVFDAVLTKSLSQNPRMEAMLDPDWKTALLRYGHIVRDSWDANGAKIVLFGVLELGLYPRFISFLAPVTTQLRIFMELLRANGVLDFPDSFSVSESIAEAMLALYVYPKIYEHQRAETGLLSLTRDPDSVLLAIATGLLVTPKASTHSQSM